MPYQGTRNGPERRQEILDYVRSCKHSPTLREIGEAVGVKASSTVQMHLMVLEREGLVGFVGPRRRVYAKDPA